MTLLLLTNYLPLADQAKNPVVFFSCLLECIGMGIYSGCLIGMLFSVLFQFDLGTDWNEIAAIRIYSSLPILVMHPISFAFIPWLTIPAISMTIAWSMAVIDLRMNWAELFPSETDFDDTPQEADSPVGDDDAL